MSLMEYKRYLGVFNRKRTIYHFWSIRDISLKFKSTYVSKNLLTSQQISVLLLYGGKKMILN